LKELGINPKDYKYLESDDKSTTLQHKRGHQLKIAHNVLSPKNQEILKALAKTSKSEPQKMADGGEANPNDPTQKTLTQQLQGAWENIKNEAASATKGMWNDKSDITPVEQMPHFVPTDMTGRQTYKDGGKISPGYEKQRKYSMNYKKGGEVPKASPGNMIACEKPFAKGGQVKEIHPNKSEPGYTKKMAEGGNLTHAGTPSEYGMPCLNPNCKSQGKPHPNCHCYGFAEGGDVEHFCAKGMPHKPDCQYFADGTQDGPIEEITPPQGIKSDDSVGSNVAAGAGFLHELGAWVNKQKNAVEKANSAQSPQPNQAPQQTQPAQSQAAPQDQDQSQDNSDNTSPDQDMASPVPNIPSSGVQQQTPGAPQQPPLTPDVPMSQQAPDRTPIQQAQETPQQATSRELQQEAMNWEHDLVNQHVTPETYHDLFAKKDTLGKIGSLFGLLVAGAGSGLTHQPNAVIQMMDNEINRDLDAQKASKSNAQHFLQLNYQHELQQAQARGLDASAWSTRQDALNKAYALSRMQANLTGMHSLIKLVNQYPEGSPQRQQAQQALSIMYPQMTAENSNIADRYAAAKMISGAGSAAPGSEQAFQNRQHALIASGSPQASAQANQEAARHIPGVPGMASKDLTEDDRQTIVNHQILDNKLKDLISYAQQHKGSVNPAVLQQAAQKAHEATSFYNKTVDGLGMTPGRMNWLDEQIKKNPTSIIQQLLGNNQRLQEIENSNGTRMNLRLKNMGFPVNQQTQKFQEGQTGTYQGKPVVFKGGKWTLK
jgi:hypothetical protein